MPNKYLLNERMAKGRTLHTPNQRWRRAWLSCSRGLACVGVGLGDYTCPYTRLITRNPVLWALWHGAGRALTLPAPWQRAWSSQSTGLRSTRMPGHTAKDSNAVTSTPDMFTTHRVLSRALTYGSPAVTAPGLWCAWQLSLREETPGRPGGRAGTLPGSLPLLCGLAPDLTSPRHFLPQAG